VSLAAGQLSVALSYLVASMLFILCLRGLSGPETARRGLQMGEVGMLLAIVGTFIAVAGMQLAAQQRLNFTWIIVGLIAGGGIGVAISGWIPMTKMPERIALSHAFGGLASALVGVSEYFHPEDQLGHFKMGALGFEVFLGFLTFNASLIAYGKLQGLITGAPITFKGQNYVNLTLFVLALVGLVLNIAYPGSQIVPWLGFDTKYLFFGVCGIALLIGVMGVLPIGGADMPVVISLNNSYAGLAACATGFALNQKVLIISGALDGSSGLLLSLLMSKAMNRSFTNILFGAFGTEIAPDAGKPVTKSYNEATVEDAGAVLKASQSVIFVPGYGMAVSQAQHAVRDLAAALEKRGVDVKHAIHPVAGRMPGHMNVLLAEANVPYDKLYDLDVVNDDFQRTDCVIIVGANDVVNPAAKKDPKSPIYGMPVFNVEQSRSIIVLKRSMNPGFSGVENELFFLPNTMMVLGDAKKTLLSMISELKEGGH
jgi:NAD(P) transhydrogenase subunit beta